MSFTGFGYIACEFSEPTDRISPTPDRLITGLPQPVIRSRVAPTLLLQIDSTRRCLNDIALAFNAYLPKEFQWPEVPSSSLTDDILFTT
jgi:hypothetical protein